MGGCVYVVFLTPNCFFFCSFGFWFIIFTSTFVNLYYLNGVDFETSL